MAPGGRIVLAPGAPQHILELCRAAAPKDAKVRAVPRSAPCDVRPVKSPGSARPPRPRPTRPTRQLTRSSSRDSVGTLCSGERTGGRTFRQLTRSSSRDSVGTLFSGERTGGRTLMRGSAVIFRRPQRSRVPPHQRPVFLVSDNGTDPRDSLDIHDPKRFSSVERAFTLRGIRHLNPLLPTGSNYSRPCSVASASSCSSPIPDAYAAIPFRPMSQGFA
eukprot:Skav217878  [mRNA]  locus=scaffold2487:230371:231024:+ [translate_table: standard]